MAVLSDLFVRNSADLPALIDHSTDPSQSNALTYADLKVLVEQFQRKLLPKISVRPHPSNEPAAVISLLLPNCVEFCLAFLAITSAGLACAPLNPKYRSDEIKFYTEDSRTQAIILPWGSASASEGADVHPAVSVVRHLKMTVWEIKFNHRPSSAGPAVQLKLVHDFRTGAQSSPVDMNGKVSKDAVALILHTSGTTSRPKCVPLTHRNITRTLHNIVNTYNLVSTDKSLVVMPLFHVHGLIGSFLSTLWSGGQAVVMPFSASHHWKAFHQHRCTWYSAVPTIHQLIMKHDTQVLMVPKRDKLNMRFIRSCSAALAPAVLRQLETMYGVPVLEAYAMTEAAHQMSSNPLPPMKRKPGSVGIPQGMEMCILNYTDDASALKQGQLGEVCIRGSNVTRGYLNRPEANRESFTKQSWFRTGDQGYFDDDGYLFLTGRLKELINRGGEKISPVEIDSVLLEHPSILEAVTFGVPDQVYDEEVNAAVIVKEGERVTTEELTRHISERLATFKLPKRIFFTKDLPRTATGKIQRRIVAEYFLKQLQAAKL